jgi:hypothetical protein
LATLFRPEPLDWKYVFEPVTGSYSFLFNRDFPLSKDSKSVS